MTAYTKTQADHVLLRDIYNGEVVGCCGVVGSTLAFGSIGHGFYFRAPLIFTSYCISLQQGQITDEVLTGRFSSSTAVVRSAITTLR